MQTEYTTTGARPERPGNEGAPVALKNDNGVVFLRQFKTNGDFVDTAVFAGDHPDAVHVEVYKERTAKKPAKKTEG